MPETLIEKITRRSEWWGECFVWTGATTKDGYGTVWYDGKNRGAHREVWIAAHGPIPSSLKVDHTCHNKNCVLLAHLRLATHAENMQNRKGANRNSKSGVLGVSLASNGKWLAQVQHKNEAHFVGYFPTCKCATDAVRIKRNELFTHNNSDRV